MKETVTFQTNGQTHQLTERGEYYERKQIVTSEAWDGHPNAFTLQLPLSATVDITEYSNNWNGGVTRFITTTPPGAYIWERGGAAESAQEYDRFLGETHVILPDGTLLPPELVDNLRFAQKELGYEISHEVWKALGISALGMNEIAE